MLINEAKEELQKQQEEKKNNTPARSTGKRPLKYLEIK